MEPGGSKFYLGNSSLTIRPEELPLLKRSAESGNVEASFRLGLYFDALTNRTEEAIYYLRKAADGGHRVARYNLGAILIESKDTVLREEGRKWLQMAADDGDSDARLLLMSARKP